MPFYYDHEADRLNISSKELETVNEALRKARRQANPPELHGNARVWYGRVFRLVRAIEELPDRFNRFQYANNRFGRPAFSIVKLLRVEPPYIRAEIKMFGSKEPEMVSLPLFQLEKAVERLVDAHENGYIHDTNKTYVRHPFTSENTADLLREHGPVV